MIYGAMYHYILIAQVLFLLIGSRVPHLYYFEIAVCNHGIGSGISNRLFFLPWPSQIEGYINNSTLCSMKQTYFPPISQPEGLPLKILDAKGKEWIFQFRFWPNNNSRMYVLEGVTPCIQSMQLQAGDTGKILSWRRFM